MLTFVLITDYKEYLKLFPLGLVWWRTPAGDLYAPNVDENARPEYEGEFFWEIAQGYQYGYMVED